MAISGNGKGSGLTTVNYIICFNGPSISSIDFAVYKTLFI